MWSSLQKTLNIFRLTVTFYKKKHIIKKLCFSVFYFKFCWLFINTVEAIIFNSKYQFKEKIMNVHMSFF